MSKQPSSQTLKLTMSKPGSRPRARVFSPPPPPAELLALLEEQNSVLVLGHNNPDGDAVGSALALAHLLADMGHDTSVAFPSPPPPWVNHIPGADMIGNSPEQASLVIAVDCDGLQRLHNLADMHHQAAHSVDIDHHTGTGRRADIVYVDPHASATGVLVFRILEALDRPLTAPVATCIYWAIATDTGFFRFTNTNAEALDICARCADAGADPHAIAHVAVGTRPLPHLILKGRALAGLQLHLEDRVLATAIGPDDFTAAGADRTHSEGIMDDIRLATDVDVYVLFKAANSDSHWEVSLRSTVADCAQIARRFAGGGHADAAGFTFIGTLNEGRARLLEALADALPQREDA